MFSIVIIAIACGLVAAISWGVADFLAAKATHSAGPVSATIAVNMVGVTGFALYYLAAGHSGAFDGPGVWYAIGTGLALGIGQITFFQGLNIGPVSLVSPLASAYPLVTTLGVVTLFHAHLSPRQLAGILFVVFGAMAASELAEARKNDWKLSRGPAFALATAVAWGIGYVFLSQSLQTLDWPTASLIQLAVIAVVCLVLGPLIAGKERVFTRTNLSVFRDRFVISAGLIQMFGLVIINIGIGQDTNMAPVVTAISACYSVLTIVLALTHLGEKFKLVPMAGALVTIIGVVILSLG